MRGKGVYKKINAFSVGITPAYAGKSIRNQHSPHVPEDHPRLCGEKYKSGQLSISHTGSPPPMRGKVDAPVQRAFFEGITPAYAGKR